MSWISTEDLERNWLWLAVDATHQLAVFQSLGEGALPPSVRLSLEEAEIIDEFVETDLLCRTAFCKGTFCSEANTYSWRGTFSSDRYANDWEVFVNGAVKVASCGLHVYYAHQGGQRPAGYYQVAFPSTPVTVEMLPPSISRIVLRTSLEDQSFARLLHISQDMIETLGG